MAKMKIYVDTGVVFEYDVKGEDKVREHMDAIVKTGYRSVSEDNLKLLTWWPPHRISKIVAELDEKSTTTYPDKRSGT